MSLIRRWALAVGVIVLVSLSAFTLAQAPAAPQSEEKPDSGKIAEKANQVLQEIDIDKIVEEALTQALRALEEVDVNAEVEKALKEVDIDKIVREALEESRRAVDEAQIEAEVREALKDADIKKALEDARKEIEKAREEIKKELQKLKEKDRQPST